MKKIVILILFFLSFSCKQGDTEPEPEQKQECEQEPEPESEPTSWDYPVKPGSEEWANFKTNVEMLAACQIPEEVLLSLSTEELTAICLRYPLLMDIYFFNSLNDGINTLVSNFNGLRELYKRDAPNELLKLYELKVRNMCILGGTASEMKKVDYHYSFLTVEALLSRFDGSYEVLKAILRSLVSGYEKEIMYKDYFNQTIRRSHTNAYSRAHIITHMGKQRADIPVESIKIALYNGQCPAGVLQILNELSYQLIK